MESFARNPEDDLKLLIVHAIKVGQSLKGVVIPEGNDKIKFIAPLFKKQLTILFQHSSYFLARV